MKLPPLKIGRLVARIPIIQGGMAVRVSTAPLAAAVAATGAIGLIGASGMELDELRSEIRGARKLAPGGIIGINIMFAAREFVDSVKTAAEEKIDLIVTGAGFSRDIYAVGHESNIPIVAIVSTAKLAKIAQKCGASAIVAEGKEAGGHLGTDRSIEELIPEIRPVVDLPLIAAGGITTGQDIVRMFKLGANGVQIATRFVLSEECAVAPEFKNVYLKANKEDSVIIRSPVGMPGRAIRNPFVEKIMKKEVPSPLFCDYCLKSCSLEYCILQALINAARGDVDEGIVFAGENVYKIKDILPAAKIIENLVREAEVV